MTGLDLRRDALIEIAVLVTDAELNVLDDGLDIVIHTGDDVLDTMVPFVRDMHASSGLTDQVRAATVTLGEAESRSCSTTSSSSSPTPSPRRCAATRSRPTAAFLARDMPALDAHLHYRMIDVSSIKELAKRWYPRVYQSQPDKGLAHRALADILESVQELPTTADAVRAAARTDARTRRKAVATAVPRSTVRAADR